MNNSIKKYVSLALQLVIAAIYFQTLYFKFTAHPDSVYIFSKLGLEPYGRIGLGIIELFTAILILIPNTKIFGIIISLGVISGAIIAHLGPVGIEIQGDHGNVFYLAVTVFIISVLLLIINFKELSQFLAKIRST